MKEIYANKVIIRTMADKIVVLADFETIGTVLATGSTEDEAWSEFHKNNAANGCKAYFGGVRREVA